MSFIVGVQGEVSLAQGVIATTAGEIVAHADAVGVEFRENYYHAAIEGVLDKLRQEVCLPNINALAEQTARCVVSVSGIDHRFLELSQLLLLQLDKIGFSEECVSLHPIAESAHVGAFLGQPGVLLRCGHGSSTFIRESMGEQHLLGGWGAVLGDAGSLQWLGRQALATCARFVDGVAFDDEVKFSKQLLTVACGSESAEMLAGVYTSLPGAIIDPITGEFREIDASTFTDLAAGDDKEQALKLLELLEFIRFSERGFQIRRYLGHFGHLTVRLAKSNDGHACDLIRKCQTQIVHLLRSIDRKFRIYDQLTLAVRGSLVERPFFCERLLERIEGDVPFLQVSDDRKNGRYSAIAGALLLAMDYRLPYEVPDSVFETLDGAEWAQPRLNFFS